MHQVGANTSNDILPVTLASIGRLAVALPAKLFVSDAETVILFEKVESTVFAGTELRDGTLVTYIKLLTGIERLVDR